METHLTTEYNQTSNVVDGISDEERHGFGKGVHLRRHKWEAVTNDAMHQTRKDWRDLIGPIETFGNANPYDGNFVALVLPFTRPERLAVSTYFLEYAFLYDDVCESANKALSIKSQSNGLILDQPSSVLGATQMQSKIIRELFQIDKLGGQRILDSWKDCMAIIRKLRQGTPYTSLDEYVPFRSLDTAAPFVHAIMAFGVSIYISPEDEDCIRDITALGYAALGLANDYFSFDREFSEREQQCREGTEPQPMVNAVWLCAEWHSLTISDAKEMVKVETLKYEAAYEKAKRDFLRSDPPPAERFWKYLDGLSQMIIGNVVWSLACPRYHPGLRYNANAGVENEFLDWHSTPSVEGLHRACAEREVEALLDGSQGSDINGFHDVAASEGECITGASNEERAALDFGSPTRVRAMVAG